MVSGVGLVVSGAGAGAGLTGSVVVGWLIGSEAGGVVWASAGKLTAAAPIKSICFNRILLLRKVYSGSDSGFSSSSGAGWSAGGVGSAAGGVSLGSASSVGA